MITIVDGLGNCVGNYDNEKIIQIVLQNETYSICSLVYDGIFKKPFFNGSEFVEGLSVEELAELNKPKIPALISRMNLKIVLLLRGITIEDIIATINSIPDSMFSAIDKQIAIIKFNEAVSFDRYNADVNLVAVLMGLSQEDLDELFLTGNNL